VRFITVKCEIYYYSFAFVLIFVLVLNVRFITVFFLLNVMFITVEIRINIQRSDDLGIFYAIRTYSKKSPA